MTQNRFAAGNALSFAPGTLAAGVRVAGARYLLKRLLGRGAFSEVWLARDRTLEHDVALKFLPQSLLQQPLLLEAIKREAHRSLQLTHPSITRVYSFIQHREVVAVSMEYADGWSLATLQVDRPQRRFDLAEVVPWMNKLCSALDYAHYEFNLVHGSLRPANLMLNARDQFKVTDFALARALSSVLSQQSGSVPLAAAYLSPQQLLGAEPSVRDHYSLGATIFGLLTGAPPFAQGDIREHVLNTPPPSLRNRLAELGVEEQIPSRWDEAVAHCLAKDPLSRPRTVSEFAQLLRLGDAPAAAAERSETGLNSLVPFLAPPGDAIDNRLSS